MIVGAGLGAGAGVVGVGVVGGVGVGVGLGVAVTVTAGPGTETVTVTVGDGAGVAAGGDEPEPHAVAATIRAATMTPTMASIRTGLLRMAGLEWLGCFTSISCFHQGVDEPRWWTPPRLSCAPSVHPPADAA